MRETMSNEPTIRRQDIEAAIDALFHREQEVTDLDLRIRYSEAHDHFTAALKTTHLDVVKLDRVTSVLVELDVLLSDSRVHHIVKSTVYELLKSIVRGLERAVDVRKESDGN